VSVNNIFFCYSPKPSSVSDCGSNAQSAGLTQEGSLCVHRSPHPSTSSIAYFNDVQLYFGKVQSVLELRPPALWEHRENTFPISLMVSWQVRVESVTTEELTRFM